MTTVSGRAAWRDLSNGSGLIAALAVAAMCAFATSARSADFGDEVYRSGADIDNGYIDDYDDDRDERRYARRWRDDGYKNHHYSDRDHNGYDDVEPDAYTKRDHYDDAPYRGSLKDDYVEPEYDRRRWRKRDYSDRTYRRGWRRADGCVPERRIRRRLRRAGWRGFRNGHVSGNIGYIHAHQWGTRDVYKLAVDRCTGEVISTKWIGHKKRGWRRQGVGFRNGYYDHREHPVIRW